MSLLLISLTAIGTAIFVIAFILIVVASFRHHTVTGLISLIPGINLVVLPTVFSKTGKAFPASIIGLGIALIAWYSGGNHSIMNYLHNKPVIIEETQNQESQPNTTTSIINSMDATSTSHKTKQSPLPSKPLYYIVYKTIQYNELPQWADRHIRVQLVDGRRLEGKNIKSTPDSLLLETHNQNKTHVIKISSQHIEQLERLGRQ